jgi:protein-S-isoprenylcysteine O-methyltransferase Ste14
LPAASPDNNALRPGDETFVGQTVLTSDFHSEDTAMRRWLFLIYGATAYVLFLGIYAYMAGFLGNFWVPKSIDSPAGEPVAMAVLVNLALLALFAVQHSVMARPAFKRIWTRIVPEPIERSTYVLASNAVTILLMWQWRGIDQVVWHFEQPVVRAAIWSLFASGWLLVPAVTMMIHHFDLFGMRQVWLHLRGRGYKSLAFRTPLLYKHVRHPLYIGWTIVFWATPTMTAGHLLFAGVLTGYIVLAVRFEERDLVAHFGEKYEAYRRQVPMFIPRSNTIARPLSQSTLSSNSEGS